MRVTLWKDREIPIDISGIARELEQLTRHIEFAAPGEDLTLATPIKWPNSYESLPEAFLDHVQDDYMALIFTERPYDNNYFFQGWRNLVVVSLFGWDFLTNLSKSNGIVLFIAELLELDVDSSVRHQGITGCLNDFKGDKRAVDAGMRYAGLCPSCLQRIRRLKLDRRQKQILADLRPILRDLRDASMWEQDLIEYWSERAAIGAADRGVKEVTRILQQNDFIPEEDPDSRIDMTRAKLNRLCGSYTRLEDTSTVSSKKGEAFEQFAKQFFGMLRGWRLVESNARLQDCEIDLIYDISEGAPALIRHLGDVIYVECKNRSKKADVAQISHFATNLRLRKLKGGIFFSNQGITGYDPVNWRQVGDAYQRIVDIRRVDQMTLLPLVGPDIEFVKNGGNLAKHLEDIAMRFLMV